jgi:hypothetical protein
VKKTDNEKLVEIRRTVLYDSFIVSKNMVIKPDGNPERIILRHARSADGLESLLT